ncbi:LysR substrate-binding domain-containing protein [Brucella intermedia]|uniref:LysR substrate-binding domain-containing protein n=1 Tax=Brucella intermedia TaxID=94625 RepID=UPI00224B5B63|nr:LysR substrate-binding domain-containing protein [Brucella intermedia]
MRKLPVLRALQTFEAVSEYPSFSRAAEKLGLTHGAISHQIRALEEWLGKELFERHSAGVTLTDDGVRLRSVCMSAFSLLEQECSRVRRVLPDHKISIGCSATFLAQWILPRVEDFSRIHPGPVLNFQTCTDLAALRAGKVDVLIVSEAQRPPGDVVGIKLSPDMIGLVCAPGRIDLPPSPHQIASSELLHASSRLSAWSEWATAMGIHIDRRGGRRFETLSLALQAARGGLGFAVTPEILVREDIEAGRLVAPFGFVPVERATWAYVQGSKHEDADIAAFLLWLLDEAKGDDNGWQMTEAL